MKQFLDLFSNVSFLESFIEMPSIDDASSVMGLTTESITDILDSEGTKLRNGRKLTFAGIDVLAKKYVERMRRYFENFITSKHFSVEEFSTFMDFCSTFSRTRTQARTWDEISEQKLYKHFESEIWALCNGLFFTELDSSMESSYSTTCRDVSSRVVCSRLYHISHVATKPTIDAFSRMTISFILMNRFHIFTSEPDDNYALQKTNKGAKFNSPFDGTNCRAPFQMGQKPDFKYGTT